MDQAVTIGRETDPRRWRRPGRLGGWVERGITSGLGLCGLATVVTTVGIVAVLGGEAARFFQATGIGPVAFVTGTEQDFVASPPRFGILPLIWGTFVITAGASAIALPAGLLAAIYLSEYASRRVRAVLKPTLELLASLPSIVYGFLALMLVTPAIRAIAEPCGLRVEGFNALSGAVVVGIMITPMVASLSEDVLSTVPRGLREAAYALGANRFEVSTRVVVPAGLSGVISSFIVAVGRAMGETMAVVLAAGMAPRIDLNPLRPIQTMTAYIVQSIGGDGGNEASAQYPSLFAVGLALFLATLALNMVAGLVSHRYREVYE